jgi:isopentenyl diphosphate isomerase/L-lactate dehydrogenase-like FMN-dependent dehydrogenase
VDSKLDRRFPSLDRIEKVAIKRLPKFLADYIYCGMGNGLSVQRNLDSLAKVRFLPRYALEPGVVDLSTSLFGQTWQAPFGIAPVGLGGFAWPAAGQLLARSAQKFGIPFCAATFALDSLEKLHQCAGESGWFQLYRPNIAEVESDLIERAVAAGYQTLLVTVDIPSPMRRSHDIGNGFTIPPQIDWFTLREILTHPVWSLSQAAHVLRHGLPKFETLEPYVPSDLDINEATQYMSDLTIGNISTDVIRHLREAWPGKLLVKGVLDPQDALIYQEHGVDGIWVSNHGGRQLEAAPSALEMLPKIRQAVGSELPLIADGGIRSGIDVCRMLASGADFVMLGRPFYYALAAMGDRGADHIVEMLISETRCAMGQLGCADIAELPDRLLR